MKEAYVPQSKLQKAVLLPSTWIHSGKGREEEEERVGSTDHSKLDFVCYADWYVVRKNILKLFVKTWNKNYLIHVIKLAINLLMTFPELSKNVLRPNRYMSALLQFSYYFRKVLFQVCHICFIHLHVNTQSWEFSY